MGEDNFEKIKQNRKNTGTYIAYSVCVMILYRRPTTFSNQCVCWRYARRRHNTQSSPRLVSEWMINGKVRGVGGKNPSPPPRPLFRIPRDSQVLSVARTHTHDIRTRSHARTPNPRVIRPRFRTSQWRHERRRSVLPVARKSIYIGPDRKGHHDVLTVLYLQPIPPPWSRR